MIYAFSLSLLSPPPLFFLHLSQLAAKISIKTVTIVGGVLFLIFGATSFFTYLNEE